jgi:TonB family protein
MSRGTAGQVKENWKSAFIGAVGIHLALAIFFIIAPNFWKRSRPMPPVYTIKLFETDATLTERSRPKSAVQKVAKKETKKVSLPRKQPKPKQEKPVSLSPKKSETTKKLKKKAVDAKNADKLLSERLKNIEERVQEKESEMHIKNRLSAIRSSVEDRVSKDTTADRGSAVDRGGSQNEALRLYCIEIWAMVRNYWVLPEQLLDKSGLVSIVAVTIAQDGSVVKAEHEYKSGHALFDQSTMKAVKKASPFPPLPEALRPGPLEIGIRFKPGEVGL